MKTLILIDKKSYAIKKVIGENPEAIVQSMDFEVDNFLKDKNIKFKSIQRYSPDFMEIDKDAKRWIKKWANKKIYGNKNIKELLDYENLSIWWLMEPWLYDSYIYYDSLENILRSISIFNIILEKEQIEKLILISDNPLYQKIAKKLTEKKKIVYIEIGTRIHVLRNLKQAIKNIAIGCYIKLIYSLRKMIWLFVNFSNKHAKIEPNSRQNKIIFFSNGPYIKCKTLNNEIRYGDPYIITIIDELIKNKKNYIKTIDVTENFLLNYHVLKEESKDRLMNIEVLESYRTREINKKVKILNKYYNKKWNVLRKNNQVKASFEYSGINIFDLVAPQFLCYFSIRLYGHLLNLELIKELIKREKPDITVFPAETSEFARSLFYVCRKANIKSVAIQHGIFENTIRCMYLKEDISKEDIQKPQYCPLPDAIVVYGPNHKRYLVTEGSYPPQKIYPLGFQKTDTLISSQKLFDKKEICEELKLDIHKKIIVLITGPFNSLKDRETLMTTTCEAVSNMKDMQLIVKVHPHEKIEFYERLIKKKKNIVITKYDILKVMYISDAVINVSSTAGLEAVILNKPLISINYIEDSKLVDYAQKGVAIGVDDPRDLHNIITEVLSNIKMQEALQKKRKRYLYEHCYKIDGKVSERISQLIEKMIQL